MPDVESSLSSAATAEYTDENARPWINGPHTSRNLSAIRPLGR
jgi:hypothetical protein